MPASTVTSTQKAVWLLGWALLMWLAVFWRLGQPTFWDPDEAHYAVTTRELLVSGDWLAPTYNHQPFFDKPILFHQLQGIAMTLVGINEFGARLVPALSSAALIGIAWWLATTLGSKDAASVAALLLTASPGLAALARYAIIDSLFTAFLFGSASVLAVAALTDRRRLQWLGYVLLALAVMTKGPVGLALVGLTFIVGLAVSRDVRQRLLLLNWVRGVALVLVLAAPWFIYMYLRFGQAFVQGYILDENLLLFSRPPYANQPGPTFYLQIIAVGMLPWTPVLLGRLWDRARAAARGEKAPTVEVLLWVWTATVLAFFSASQFKLDHYIFPVAPALCVLCGLACSDALQHGADRRHLGVLGGLRLIGPILVIGGIAVGIALRQFDLPMVAWTVPVVWCGLGLVHTVRGARAAKDAAVVTAAAFGTFYLIAVGVILPRIEEQKVVADVGRWVVSQTTTETQVCSYRLNRWNNSLLFYAERQVTITDEPERVRSLTSAGTPYLCVMTASARDELTARGMDLPVLYQRDGLWATSGRALRRSRGALTSFVVTGRTDATGAPPR